MDRQDKRPTETDVWSSICLHFKEDCLIKRTCMVHEKIISFSISRLTKTQDLHFRRTKRPF